MMKRLLLVPLLAASIWLAVGNEKAAADYLAPRFGGDGGGYFLRTCPHGKWLVGFWGNTGNWVDNIHLICANAVDLGTGGPSFRTSKVEFDNFKIGASNGGGPNRAQCPINSVVGTIQVGWGEYAGGSAIIN